MKLYQSESSNPKYDAQRNLQGRSHYVDDGNLRFHYSRVLSTDVAANGLLFTLIESCALDMNNRERGFRYVIFDVFGTVLSRVELEHSFKTSKAAYKAMQTALKAIDAKAHTLQAIEQQQKYYASELDYLRAKVNEISQGK